MAVNQAFAVQEKLAELESALLANDPKMPEHLRTIHRQLKSDPDVVTLLSEEEVAIIVKALKKQTGTELATVLTKKAPKKALSKLSVDDL